MISLIVALDENNLIGCGNQLPWHYAADLKYFKKVTTGKAVVMGYNTYLSIYQRLGKALPNRKNYVLTYEHTIPGEGIIVEDVERLFSTFENNTDEIFIIGGKMIYETYLAKAQRLYITRIHDTHQGDVYFPPIPFEEYRLIQSNTEAKLTFAVYEKVSL